MAKKKKVDTAILRSKYAAYRKRMTANPKTILSIKPFKVWKETYLKKEK